MGMFGKGLSGQSVLDFALGGYAGLDRRKEMEARQELYAPQAAPAPAAAQAPAPGFDPSAFGSAGEASKAGYRPEPPRLPAGQPATPGAPVPPQIDWQRAMKAAAAGVNIDPYLKIHQGQRPDYQGFNRDGGLYVLNPQTGKAEFIADPDTPESQAKIDVYKAQARSYDALGNQREAKAEGPQIIEAPDGLYEYDPTTRQTKKLNGWARFAPPRAGGGGRGRGVVGSHSAPSGFVVQP